MLPITSRFLNYQAQIFLKYFPKDKFPSLDAYMKTKEGRESVGQGG